MKKERKILNTIIHHQKPIIIVLSLLIAGTVFVLRRLQGKLLLSGAESYYLLNLFQLHVLPKTASHFLPETVLAFLPPLVSVGTILLLYKVIPLLSPEKTSDGKVDNRRINDRRINKSKIGTAALLLIFTPVFMWYSTAISAFSFVLFFVLIGTWLILLNKRYSLLAIVPFLLATAMDLLTALLVLAIQLAILHKAKLTKLPSWKKYLFLGSTLVSLSIQQFLLHQPFIYGPFHPLQRVTDLISDLGGYTGLSISLLFLAAIGLCTLHKNSFRTYAVFLPLLGVYLLNPESILFLAIILCGIAAEGYSHLFDRPWTFSALRHITIFILVLSMLFSATTFLQRQTSTAFPEAEKLALEWINGHTPAEAIVYSSPDRAPLISYYAQRQPFTSLYLDRTRPNYQERLAVAEHIWNSTYVQATFPLLEQNSITIFYIHPEMRASGNPSQGLLFLLKNERFKTLYSLEGHEVWLFTRDSLVPE